MLEVLENGEIVGAVAVEVLGPDATITAAVSRGQASFGALVMIEDMLKRAGVRRVAVCTRRLGLIHRMSAMGYAVEACRMVKDI